MYQGQLDVAEELTQLMCGESLFENASQLQCDISVLAGEVPSTLHRHEMEGKKALAFA